MRSEIKVQMEMNLIAVFALSSLKVKGSCLANNKQFNDLIVNVASNLIASKTPKDQLESPLMASLVQF